MINCRGSFIRNIIHHRKCKDYLEIGLSENPLAPYRMIRMENKTSIDMNPKTNPDFCMSSDNFFEDLHNEKTHFAKDHKWDAIFIDGDHFAEQVYKDLCNAFEHLSDDGVIFLHDSLPWHYYMTIESKIDNRGATCQDAWKVIEYCLKEREDMHVCTIEENGGGLGLVIKANSPRPMLPMDYNRFYQYGVYEREKFKFMNTIPEDKVLGWIKEPFYNFGD